MTNQVRPIVLLPSPAPRNVFRTLLSAAAALCLTLAMFLILPLSELLHPPPPRRMELREIDTTRWTPPKSPQRPPPPKPEPRVPRRKPRMRPRLFRRLPPRTPQVRPPALHLPARLALSLPELAGDMALDFGVRPPVATGPPPAPAPSTKSVYTREEADTPPRPVVQVPPIYPYKARLRGIEGYVEIRFVVTPLGKTESIEIVAEQPPGIFAEAARKAVRRWRFEPGCKDGKPVPVRMQVRLRFVLER